MIQSTTAYSLADDKMSEEIKKHLHQLIGKVPGLYGIVFTDRDGVPILKAANETAPEHALRPLFLATAGMATDQAGKLGIGKCNRIICMYKNNQVIHFNRNPIMVTLIADGDTNAGLLISLESDLTSIAQDLKVAVDVV